MLKIIADFPWQGDSLNTGVGNNGSLGGAEHELNALTEILLIAGVDSEIIKSSELQSHIIESTSKYLVTNFWQLSPACKAKLIEYGNYIIIENDFKISPSRVVDRYPNCTIPLAERINLDFYRGANQVFCLSKAQKDIFALNGVHENVTSLGTSFWTEVELCAIESYAELRSNVNASFSAVYGYKTETKGTNDAIQYCSEHALTPVILFPTNKLHFFNNLSSCERLVFLPRITESFSRITIEAYLLGLDVVYNDKVSAAKELWVSNLRNKMTVADVKNQMSLAIDNLIEYI